MPVPDVVIDMRLKNPTARCRRLVPSHDTVRMNSFYALKSREMTNIERDDLRNAVRLHDSHQSCVVNLRSDQPVADQQAFPKCIGCSAR